MNTKKQLDNYDEEEKQGLLDQERGSPDKDVVKKPQNLNQTAGSDLLPIPLRTFDINKIKQNSLAFCNNQITTSKYSVITFLPKNLIDQFSKLANIYFLLMMILQTIPQISITGGQPTILLPLMFVITVSAVKDIFEDLKRHKSDNVENTRKVLRLDKKNKNFVIDSWKNLRVGQIVQVLADQYFPADLALLRSSNNNGIAYVETKNLDGETNLKHKSALKELQAAVSDPAACTSFRGSVTCEAPNDQLYKFEGTIKTPDNVTYSLDHNSILLRGTSLRNTEWVYGIVIYTGHDSKIMKNSSKARTKFSKLELQTNKQIILIFIFQILICVIGASFNQLWTLRTGQTYHPYLALESEDDVDKNFWSGLFADSVTRFGTWLLLFANFVPISLIVTLEVVKFLQAQFIQWDAEIYDVTKDLNTKVQTSNLNEQLGQVDYVFSDKTGTLTCNLMEYKKHSVGKYSYGVDGAQITDAKEKDVTNFNFQDDIFVDHMSDKNHPNHKNIQNFLTHLAICHTVVAEAKDGKVFYNASSPDELALVNCAKYFGYFFKGRDDDNNIEVSVDGKTVIYQLLGVIEFSSDRKRMTVIVRTPEGKIMVLCKGADSIVQARLSNSDLNNEVLSHTVKHLETYASTGLRTLLLAEKELTEAEYQAFKEEYRIAASSMIKRDDKMAEVADRLEQNFEIVGTTAIEDKLQDDVDKAIFAMKKAGIKVWVLTGDKIETAINIGFSCQLLNDKMELYVIDGATKADCLSQIADSRKMQINSEGLRTSGTVVSGESLFKIMSSQRITKQFLKLACSSSVLIACRMSPKQKADIVRLIIANNPDLITLAIGDGANDVNMINAAHIGVGISGVEGQQAVSASDYAIGQFKYLKNLLFVHGRESYRKNSYLVCYTFYKNVLFVMPQFWFGFYSAFSGQVFYEKWIYQIFNIIFTAFPIIIFALFDQQNSRQYFMQNPKEYKIGLRNQCFGTVTFWKWIFYGMAQSAAVFYIAFITFNTSLSKENGSTGDLWLAGTFAYGAIVIICNMTILYGSFSHTAWSIFIIQASVVAFFCIFWLLSYVKLPTLDHLFNEIITFPTFYLNLFFFFTVTFPVDRFLYFINEWAIDNRAYAEKQKKIKEKKKFTKGLDPSRLAPIQRYTGFAFSGEQGHVPQITDKLLRATTNLISAQRLLPAIKNPGQK